MTLQAKGMLDGVKILDLSRLLPGPACTWYLSEQGAEVISVEPPKPSLTRLAPPHVMSKNGKVGSYFHALHGGKKSICLQLRHEAARAVILKLVEHCDVLVEGFKPGTLEKMGLSPKVLHTHNPQLIIARISGYGQTGPLASSPGHDINYLAHAGVLAGAPSGSNGHALYSLQIADLSGAMTAALGICAALYERSTTRVGRVLDISLCESALSFLTPHFQGTVFSGEEPSPAGELLNGGVPQYRSYECSDARWLSLGALEPKFFQRAKEVLGNNPQLWAEQIKKEPLSHWVKVLSDACAAPVLSYAELVEHPQHRARGSIQTDSDGISWIRAPFFNGPPKGAPILGEHGIDILSCYFSSDEIDQLLQSKTLITPPS